jgi:hypothetical protein
MAQAQNWAPKERRRKVSRDLAAIRKNIGGMGSAVINALTPAPSQGVTGGSQFASALRPRVEESSYPCFFCW